MILSIRDSPEDHNAYGRHLYAVNIVNIGRINGPRYRQGKPFYSSFVINKTNEHSSSSHTDELIHYHK